MSAHASQAFSIASCTDSEDLPTGHCTRFGSLSVFVVHLGMNVTDNGNIIAPVEGHTNKHPDSVRRRTASDLSRTIAGQEENAGTTAHAGTSVGLFAAMKRIVRSSLTCDVN